VSNPSVGTSGTWDRFLAAYQNGGSLNKNSVIVGIEKIGKGGGGYCPGGGGLYYFMAAYDSYGDNILGAPYCSVVSAGDINQNVQLQVSPYSSNGGGMQAIIHRYNGTLVFQSYPYADGTPHSFSRNQHLEQIASVTWTGHLVWGVQWLYSQYYTGSQWQSQARGYDYQTVRGGVPNLYWYIVPVPDNSGGILYSCVYDYPYDPCYPGR
jgi:hypothetical protein